MAKKKKFKKKQYTYNCAITGEKFVVTREAPHPDELVSVNAYYEMHPELDDRPDKFKAKAEFMEAPEEENTPE